MSVIRAIAVFLCGISGQWLVSAQVPFLGTCPNVSVQNNFDATRYLGKWYEQERYFAVFQLGGKCVTAEYSLRDDGTIRVFNRQISTITGIETSIEGEATQVSRSDEGKLSVRFPSMPFNFAAPYWVIDTDYDNYAIVYGCNDFNVFHARNAWVLTRERIPPMEVQMKISTALEKSELDGTYFIKTDQKNCPEKK